jgi:hypothetical protein
MMKGCIIISIGKWGGIYAYLKKGSYSKRICLGWVALSFFPDDGDDIIELAAIGSEYLQAKRD